jgi:flagellar P-ring protein precursor FlgI
MMRLWLFALSMLLLTAHAAQANQVRIKDLVDFDGVRGNDLVGYGLVVGLDGTGDGLRNAPFTEDIMTNILERLGVNVTGEQFRPKNVAAVLVTATLPPFARAGGQIDVTVSAIGDATSLMGGTLVMTPMNAADGDIYAVAQGTIIAGGVVAEGDADFTTAERIEDAINRDFGRSVAIMLDSGTVQLNVPATRMRSVAHALSRIENIAVEPERKARVVVDQRSGTIVMGEDVRISRVAVSQGNLTLRIQEEPLVVQPNPFAEGETVVVPRTNAAIEEEEGIGLAEIRPGTSLSEVIAGLNALGVSPRDMIDILKSIKAAGALHAEFVVR